MRRRGERRRVAGAMRFALALTALLAATGERASYSQPLGRDHGATAAVAPAATSYADPDDERWDGRFHLPGVNGAVFAMASDGAGNLYVGGSFSIAGDVRTRNIARWDGARWHPLGAGIDDEGFAPVFALAVDPHGDVYAGGSFERVGGVAARYVARWDGTGWSALGQGLEGAGVGWPWGVHALLVDGQGNLHAGGWFWASGDPATRFLARWNGTRWSSLGSGVNGGVLALASSRSGGLYAGGVFTVAGEVAASNVARWEGEEWSALGLGMSSTVDALAVDAGGDLIAAGDFRYADGRDANRIAIWQGEKWSALGAGLPESENVYANALAVDEEGAVYVGGLFSTAGEGTASSIARWDGFDWHALGSGIGGTQDRTVYALTVTPGGDLYAGGHFTAAGARRVNALARWSEKRWEAVGQGQGADAETFCLAVGPEGKVCAGGGMTEAGGAQVDHIGVWDGRQWSALGGGFNGSVYAIALGAWDKLYAGGAFTLAGGVEAAHVALWDGLEWSPLGGGLNGTVHALALDESGRLYAGGTFTVAGDVSARYVAMWDGTGWSALDAGMDDRVMALALTPEDDLIAAGAFTNAGGRAAAGIARWEGSSWAPLGSGLGASDGPGVGCALAIDHAGRLFVGGFFDQAGGRPARYVAAWDGAAWTALGEGTTNTVTALGVDGRGDLVVGGYFDSAGGSASPGIALWNGATWRSFGSGVDGVVRSVAGGAEGDVFVAGAFTTAGGKPSGNVGLWHGGASISVPISASRGSGVELGPATPNPFVDRATLRLVVRSGAAARIEIFAISGARVRTLVPAGPAGDGTALEWDGRDSHGVRMSPGLYFVRASAGPDTATRRVLLLR